MAILQTFTTSQVNHIASLAQIPLKSEEELELSKGFETTIAVVNRLQELDTSAVSRPLSEPMEQSHHFRDDVVNSARQFTQEQALANATSHQGFIMVKQVREEK